MLLAVAAALLPLLALSQEEPDDEGHVALVQVGLSTRRGRTASTATSLTSDLETLLQDAENSWRDGRLSKGGPITESCGKATNQDLTTSISIWRKAHPGVDAFCYFQNFAWWFQMAGPSYQSKVPDVRVSGRNGYLNTAKHVSRTTFPRGTGPALSLTYDAGTLHWDHVDTSIDLVDDLYCHSLGWLKGQTLDARMAGQWKNYSHWHEVGSEDCRRMQEKFQFLDEEVTVGTHIFSTARELTGAVCSARQSGDCQPVTQRQHSMHVYTKCLMGEGAAVAEMAYCYMKGCLLPGNRIGHDQDCGYEL